MTSINSLELKNPTISDGKFGKFIKADDSNTKQIIDSFNKNGKIIITAHLESKPTTGGMFTNAKFEPKLVLDTMYLNPDLSIDLKDENKGFEITSGGLIESNSNSDIKVNVLGPLKSLLSVAEVKQGSQGVIPPANGVTGSPSSPPLPSTADTGEKIVAQATQIRKDIKNTKDPAKLSEFKAALEILKTNISKLNDDDAYYLDAVTIVDDTLIDVIAALTPRTTIKSDNYLNVGGSTRRRKYKKRTTLRNKRRTYRYKK